MTARILRVASLGTVLSLAVTPPMARAQSIPVTLGGETSSLVGVAFDVPIVVDMSARTELLGSFQLTVNWDPAVLEVVSGQDGQFGSITINDDSLATGWLVASGVNPSGIGGKFTVAVVRFRPRTAATTNLVLAVNELFAATTFADLTSSAVPSDREYCPALGRLGDLDGDGASNSRDALIALSAAVGLDVSGFNAPMGDVDRNGATEARDALIILSYGVGLDVSQFPIYTIAPGACAAGVQPALALDPGDLTVSPGQEIAYTAAASDAAGNRVAVTDVFWSTSDDRVAIVGPSGVVTAIDTGTAVITARRIGGDNASATLTVTADRHVFWVDALAWSAVNQLGDPLYPFAAIQQAVDFAGEGDTVRVRPGTYGDGTWIDGSVVLEGDTSLGGTRPFIAANASYSTGFFLDGGSRVEIRGFVFDTVYQAIGVGTVDTVALDNLEFRMRATGSASVYIDTVSALYVHRSRFFGAATSWYSNNAIEVWGAAGLVAMDSSVVADYGDDGLDLNNVDSLDLRDNLIRNNYGWGISLCNECFTSDTTRGVAAYFYRNRFVNSQFGQVSLSLFRSARFERNVFVGGGGGGYYDAVDLVGHGGSLASFFADSFDVTNGPWLDLYRFDSLSVDSAVVAQRDDYAYIRGGRIAVVRDSRFLELTWGALEVDAWPRDTAALVLQNVDFLGPDSSTCDQCGTGVWADGMSITADGVTGVNLGEVFDLYDTDLALSNSSFQHTYWVVYTYCGTTRLDGVSAFDGQYGVYHSGCVAAEDTLAIDASQFEFFYQGVYADDADSRIEGSSFLDVDYPIEVSCGNLTARHDTLSNGFYGIEAYGCFVGGAVVDSLVVDTVRIEQFADWGIYGHAVQSTVTRNVFADVEDPVYLNDGRMIVTDNVATGVGGYGLDVSSDTYGSVFVERNSVTCDFLAGGYDGIEAWSYDADSTTVRDNTVTDCRSGIYARGPIVEVRGNTVTMPANAGITVNGIEAIADTLLRVVANAVTGPARYGSIDVVSAKRAEIDTNTITASIDAGILVSSVDSLWVRDNTVASHDTTPCTSCLSSLEGAIVLWFSSATNVLAKVTGNRITTSKRSGIVLERTGSTDTVTILVDSNSVKNPSEYGIRVYRYTRAKLTRNAIDGSGLDALWVDRWTTDAAALVANNNNFTNSARYGFNTVDGSGALYDATNNWWNDPLGPSGFYGETSGASTGDSVSANVLWSPALVAPQGDAPTPAPPAMIAALSRASVVAGATVIAPLRAGGRLRGSVPLTRPARQRTVELRPVLPRALAPDDDGRFARLGIVDRHAATRRAEQAETRAAQWAERLAREAERAAALAARDEERAERRARHEERRRARAAERAGGQEP